MSDARLIATFLEAQAAELDAAENTLLAYARDLQGFCDWLKGRALLKPPRATSKVILLIWTRRACHARPERGGFRPFDSFSGLLLKKVGAAITRHFRSKAQAVKNACLKR